VATQLSIYNGALLLCKERFIAALTEENEPRRLLDHVWSSGGVRYCLARGQWTFAMRTVQIDYDSGIEPDFGYRRAFEKPSDWVVTSALCSDEFFRSPLMRYVDEAGYWYADIDTLFVRHVSDDAAYGMDLNQWSESFARYVEGYFASRIIGKLKSSDREGELKETTKDLLLTAKNESMMAEPTKFPAQGSWSAARNRYPNRRDGGGSSGNLIG
jgi:hypothetical protein